jgi:hypothetical protein
MKARQFISTAVALLALAAPAAALAGSSPDDRALPRGTTWNQPQQISPDDRAVPRGTTFSMPAATKTAIVSPDDRAFARSNPSVARPTLILATGGSFDWTDAGLGAASGFGLALVLLGAALLYIRRDSGRPVAA